MHQQSQVDDTRYRPGVLYVYYNLESMTAMRTVEVAYLQPESSVRVPALSVQ